MNRIYCVECREFMVKEKTGFLVTIEKPHATLEYRGDLYRCPKCKREVYGDFGEPYEARK